ncbi:MAG: ribonuclease Y [Candidatus Omnitrophota bacterium]|nr:ribonuclease Y [Candidatus Omnitrophota bacterium]MDZ4242525.1 ribonuclease Y [Candidatus Omnitrophota bacterium]
MFEDQNIYIQSFVMFSLFCLVFFAGYLIRSFFAGKKLREAEQKAKELTESASREVESRRKEAELAGKELMLKLRQDFERETKERRDELVQTEKRILQKEENLDKRVDLLEKKEKDINARLTQVRQEEDSLRGRKDELAKIIEEEKKRLQTISSMTSEEAKALLLAKMDEELTQEKSTRIRRAEEEVKENVDKIARNIIATAIQRSASDHTAETTISVVALPSDEMKGRIIGREGRNIRALEMATGVDVIIDDTPEAVTISGFDMMRREIARIALESLIADGRIHPGRIEEVVEKAKKEIENKIKEEGDKAAFELGIHGMHPELLKLVGRLKYRTSFGQNGLQHTKEVAHLMNHMSAQLGLDPKPAIRAGLLHDIGKVVSQEVEEGTHAIVGANLARKYGEIEIVVNAVAAHHNEVESNSIYGTLLCAADAISAARPGARAETLETYVKRLESLEKIANSFKGVEKAFALQAGREVRIMVMPDKINDDEAIVMARDIRKRVEQEMEYPGQIKVVVVRETRAIEYAK